MRTAAAMWLCAAVLLAVAGVASAQALASPIRAGCQMGKPPFSDAHGHVITATKCEGLFADVFYLAMQRLGQNFTMTMIDDDDVGQYVTVNNATNTTQYDIIVAFHTVTPDRLNTFDFSISMYQTQYRAGLLPEFHKSAAGLASSVIRDSVWYLLAVVSTMALVLGLVLLVAESFHPESELMQMSRWRRGLTCAEAGFETMMSGSTSLALASQISRSVRALFAIMAMFVIAIFGAVITSQLTADAASQKQATVADLQGQRIAHALPSLHTWLQQGAGATVTEVRDIETFGDGFYRGQQPGFKGYVAESDVVAFLHNLHGGAAGGYTVTEEFTPHGSVDLKAFPWSRNLPRSWRDAFNIELERIREDGELAALASRQVSKFELPVADDITVGNNAFVAFRAVAIGLYAAFVLFGIGLFVVDKLTRRPADEEEGTAPTKVHDVVGASGFVWRGKVYNGAPPELLQVLDTIAADGTRR
uniref:Solute-binding protein family 3/N-terminal domain-containing protein n=1 Tax=Neobodo designis TaxID=312471 RepID=A0A7S1ME98_NEODS